MLSEGLAGLGAETRHHVHDSLRNARFETELREPDGGQGRLLRRLEHDRVPERESRCHLPCGHDHGEVPRDDPPHTPSGSRREYENMLSSVGLVSPWYLVGHPA